MSLSRSDLQRIRDEALQHAQAIGTSNILAMRAYAELASAADHVDALLARSSSPPKRQLTSVVDEPRPAAQPADLDNVELEEPEVEEGEEEYDPTSASY